LKVQTVLGSVEVDSNTTDDNGNYIFKNLNPDTQYTVCIKDTQFKDKKGVDDTVLEKMALTTANLDKDTIDSDMKNSDSGLAYITLTTGYYGDNNHSYDIGLINTYCIGDRIWLDENKDGIQDDGEDNFTDGTITIELLDENNNTATDANGDEVQPIDSSDGTYKFCNLLSDNYKIKITPPDGYVATIKDSGSDDEKDSDIDKSTNQSDLIELRDDDNLTIDIGLYKLTYCLGDYIWDDENQDGTQDDNESGVSGVSIKLYDGDGNELNSTTTDGSGKYSFCGLSNGDYYIEVNKSTIPDDYIITSQDQRGDDTKDSDINPNNGKSSTVTINDGNITTLDGGIHKTYCLGD